MPSQDWIDENPKVSAYIPRELHQKLEVFMKQRGIDKTSNALKVIIDEFLNGSQWTTQNSTIEKRLSILEKEFLVIKQQTNNSSAVNQDIPLKKSTVVQSKLLLKDGEWLTTGEAYTKLQKRGYTKSVGTFRRSLRGGVMPGELERIGLFADWEKRSQGNPKDNSVKWLRLT